MQECSFFSNSFLEFCFLTAALSSIILSHKFIWQQIDTLKIPLNFKKFSHRYMTTWSKHNSDHLAKNRKKAWMQQDVLQREQWNEYESFPLSPLTGY